MGIDGVPLWHSHVISVSICLLADIEGLPIHGPHSSFVSAIMRGYESVQSMEDLIKTIKLSEDIFALNGSEIFIDGQSYTWRVFVTGDHMCIYKLLGADGPTSLLAHRQPCPYCNIPADKLRNYREPIRPMVRKPGALLRHPVNQQQQPKGSIAAHGPRRQVDLVQRIGDKATNPMPQIFSVDSVRQQRRFLLTRALTCMCSVCLFLCLVALLHTVRL